MSVRKTISKSRRVAALLLVAAALAGGCAEDDGGPDAVWISGKWSGSLGIFFKGGGGSSGALDLDLGQSDDFVSGIAEWTPSKVGLPVAGPLDGAEFTLILHFRCENPDTTSPTTEITEGAVVTGYETSGTLVFTGASGTACPGGGIGRQVDGASGSVGRGTNGAPLAPETKAPPPEPPPEEEEEEEEEGSAGGNGSPL